MWSPEPSIHIGWDRLRVKSSASLLAPQYLVVSDKSAITSVGRSNLLAAQLLEFRLTEEENGSKRHLKLGFILRRSGSWFVVGSLRLSLDEFSRQKRRIHKSLNQTRLKLGLTELKNKLLLLKNNQDLSEIEKTNSENYFITVQWATYLVDFSLFR